MAAMLFRVEAGFEDLVPQFDTKFECHLVSKEDGLCETSMLDSDI